LKDIHPPIVLDYYARSYTCLLVRLLTLPDASAFFPSWLGQGGKKFLHWERGRRKYMLSSSPWRDLSVVKPTDKCLLTMHAFLRSIGEDRLYRHCSSNCYHPPTLRMNIIIIHHNIISYCTWYLSLTSLLPCLPILLVFRPTTVHHRVAFEVEWRNMMV
jgi:hypothetical protein